MIRDFRTCLRIASAGAILVVVSQAAWGARTTDRLYLFGDHPNENASAGIAVGVNEANGTQYFTFDSDSNTSMETDPDAINLEQNSSFSGALYVDVSAGPFMRTGASGLGAQFDGTDDALTGIPLNVPAETVGPIPIGDGPFVPQPPVDNYHTIFGRGLQAWIYPESGANLGSARQSVVSDTIRSGGIEITENGTWGIAFDTEDTTDDTEIDSNVAVVADTWHHVMHHIHTSGLAGSPTVLSGGGDSGQTAVVYVAGVAVSASNDFAQAGGSAPDNRNGFLVVGASEEVNGTLDHHFDGIVDDLEMYINGNNIDANASLTGQDYGTFDLFSDNDFIADAITAVPDLGLPKNSAGLTVGDANLDGNVTQADIDIFVANWLSSNTLTGWGGKVIQLGDWATYQNGDFNVDGIVDLTDAFTLHTGLLNSGGPALSFDALGGVPEPSSIALLGIGLCSLIMRRRRH